MFFFFVFVCFLNYLIYFIYLQCFIILSVDVIVHLIWEGHYSFLYMAVELTTKYSILGGTTSKKPLSKFHNHHSVLKIQLSQKKR